MEILSLRVFFCEGLLVYWQQPFAEMPCEQKAGETDVAMVHIHLSLSEMTFVPFVSSGSLKRIENPL